MHWRAEGAGGAIVIGCGGNGDLDTCRAQKSEADQSAGRLSRDETPDCGQVHTKGRRSGVVDHNQQFKSRPVALQRNGVGDCEWLSSLDNLEIFGTKNRNRGGMTRLQSNDNLNRYRRRRGILSPGGSDADCEAGSG